MFKKLTPLIAIRKKCLNCKETRTDIRNCEFKDCQLYPFKIGKGRPKLKDIRKYCLWCMNNQENEVSLCPSKECSLFLYKLGHNPSRRGIGANKEVMANVRGSIKSNGLKMAS